MNRYTRREFLRDSARLAGGVTWVGLSLEAAAKKAVRSGTPPAKLPQRPFGRSGVKVPLLGFGLAPLGSDASSPLMVTALLNHALDRGVTYFDVSPDYGAAEDKLRPVLAQRRDEVFLVTKVNPGDPTRAGVQRQLERSLKRMGTDHVDAAHIHNLGDFEMETLFAPDGAVAGLKEARQRGLLRFIGVSGHMRPHRFHTALDTGEFDLAMMALNFADRHRYDFEGLALPVAQKHGVAVVAMKVLGGARNWAYNGATPGCFAAYHKRAIRYSLALPGVCAAVIGFSNEAELDAAVEVAKAYKPLPKEERDALLAEGMRLSDARGLYYGSLTG